MTFNIELRNCNNIDQGKIQIFENKLNIKFGINGTGKSTIAKAVEYKIKSPDELEELTPFKIQNSESNEKPEILIPEDIKSILIFNEEYLEQFAYQEKELISDSFEIFIKSPNYEKSIEEIQKILETIQKVFQEDDTLKKAIEDFTSLANSFKITSTGKLSKTSTGVKVLENGNPIKNIPDDLKPYSEFIANKDKCTAWLGWQMKGVEFLNLSENCPFCSSKTEDKKDIINSVSKTYDKNMISKLINLIDNLNDLGNYFSDDAKKKITDITTKNTGLDDEEINYLLETKKQIDLLLNQLNKLLTISPNYLAEKENIEEEIKNLEIKLDYLDRFDSEETKRIVKSLNDSLQEVLGKITDLKRAIGQQKSEIKKRIAKHKNSINQFLEKAGYKYEVEISDDEDDDYKLKLKHKDSDENISRGNQYLSFGEKNAFGLVLFMYHALSKNPDLIILDDPISSFDKHKKYAIMDMLFRENNSFKGKTVLMLTHDIEPIIDTAKVLYNQFKDLSTSSFINTKNNELKEIEIKKDDVLSLSQICKIILGMENIKDIIKVIYLRRYYEAIDDKSDEYEVLSNLLHKRTTEELTDHRKDMVDGEHQELSIEDFQSGIEGIKQNLQTFDYNVILEEITCSNKLIELYNEAEDGFVKIILFRLLIEGLEGHNEHDSVFMKFINEIYHIENDFLFQLNPLKFDVAPSFIIEECDKFVKGLEVGSENE